MEYLGIIAIILTVWYFDWKDDRKRTADLELLKEKHKKLQAGTRSLIWALGNQTEKVPGHIQSLLPLAYKEPVSEDMKFEIDKRIKRQIYRS